MPKFNETIYTDKPYQCQATHVRKGYGKIVMIDPVDGDGPQLLAHGPRLRDALLEAFPLGDKPAVATKDEPLADWEKELLGALTEPPRPNVVPGMVFKDKGDSLRVALSGDSWFVVGGGRTWTTAEVDRSIAPWNLKDEVVFDPRGAKALPNPLGIRVGDRVRKVAHEGHDNGAGGVKQEIVATTEFVVNHIDGVTGNISPIRGGAYATKGFEVVSRKVPDRLPAGTIVRLYSGDLRLITNEGGIHLTGYVNPRPDHRDGSDYGRLVKDGDAEVIYLP